MQLVKVVFFFKIEFCLFKFNPILWCNLVDFGLLNEILSNAIKLIDVANWISVDAQSTWRWNLPYYSFHVEIY